MSELIELSILYIDEFLKEYKVNISNKTILSLVEKSLNELDEKSKKDLITNPITLKNFIRKIIEKYLKSILKNNDSAFDIINDYLNREMNMANDYHAAIKEVSKLSTFLNNIRFIPNPDIIIRLFEENSALATNIKIIIEKIISFIKAGQLDEVTTDNTLITLIEVYCMLNDIEIAVSEDISTPCEFYSVASEETEVKSSKTETYSVDSYKKYLQEIGMYKLLSREEERELILRMYEGDEAAKEKLINHNLRLVVSIAKRYQCNSSLDLLDHIQSGNIGLMTAIEKYDLNKGYRLATYATSWIRQAISKNFADNGRNIRIPVYKINEISWLKRTREKLESKFGCSVSKIQLAEALGISKEKVEELLTLEHDTYSLHGSILESKGTKQLTEEVPLTDFGLEDAIDSRAKPIEEEAINLVLSSGLQELFKSACLTPREIDIVISIYGLEMRQCEVAKKHNISGERVRQIAESTIKRLIFARNIRDYSNYMDDAEVAEQYITAYRKLYYTPRIKPYTHYDQEALAEIIRKLEPMGEYTGILGFSPRITDSTPKKRKRNRPKKMKNQATA